MKDIIVIGSLNMDLVTQTSRLPLPGETIHGMQFKMVPGGKGANQAAAAALLGGNVYMAGSVGGDSFGTQLTQNLSRKGVNTEYVLTVPETSTGIASILVDEHGENSIVVVAGANFKVKKEDIDAVKPLIARCGFMMLQFEIPLDVVAYAVETARQLGVKTVLNPAPAYQKGSAFIHLVDYLILNETEIELFSGIKVTGHEMAEQAARVLLKRGVQTVLVTLGGDGVLLVNENTVQHVPAWKVKVVDTTAAGDAFTAGFTVALADGKSLEEAVDYANVVGAITVTRFGAQTSLPTRDEVAEYMAKKSCS